MEDIIKDFASWLDNNGRLKVNRQIPPFENSGTIANYYIKTILPEFVNQRARNDNPLPGPTMQELENMIEYINTQVAADQLDDFIDKAGKLNNFIKKYQR